MDTSRHVKWAELVETGGAAVFFESFPSDAELAKKINEMLVDSPGEITEGQVHRDRQRFHQRPLRGEVREVKEASPTKNVILNKAKQLDVRQALAEILDNIFDNFERNPSQPKLLRVEIVAYPPAMASPGEIIIHENSGGIPSKQVVPLIQLGASDRAQGGIGAWGEGFKMAAFALGQEVEVFSSFPKEQPIAIYFPRGWLDPNSTYLWTQWKVETFAISRNPPPEGTTIIRINHLHQEVLDFLGIGKSEAGQNPQSVCDNFAVYFGEVYAEKYRDLISRDRNVSITLKIGDCSRNVEFIEPVEQRLLKNLAFLPWLRPIRWRKTWTTELKDEGRTAKLEVTIYGGLAATPEKYSPKYQDQLSKPGVEMWGNGRMFSLEGRITDESVGWGYTYGGRGGRNPTSNASYRRLTAIALFSAEDSRDIPWAAPVKNDYNRRSDFYAEIKETLARVIRLFKDAHALLDFVLLPFSYVWTEYDDQEKLGILFQDTVATPKFIQDFAESRFGKKVLAFHPTLTFKDVDNDDGNPPTNDSLYRFGSIQIKDLGDAAVATKQQTGAQRVKFLEAIFPGLAKQAAIEEQIGLDPEEFTL